MYIQYKHIYIANLHIFQKLVIPPTLCPKGTRKPSKLHSSPKCWHGISNTKIFIQLIHNPKMYIPPTLCPKGTRKPSKLHSSPKSWHYISNTHIYLANWHIFQNCTFPQQCARMAQGNSPKYLPPPRIGMLYPIQIYILNRNI